MTDDLAEDVGLVRPWRDAAPYGGTPDVDPLAHELVAAEPTATDGAAEFTETQLEALLFVAERPLSRREIASLAGVDRATVDALLGDLEVSLR
ncbi:MAG TPA: hypothetical protein VGQ85_08135, partial [Candidatus Limnocylindrales bacterium]|nr:hypothetical protein [Candidatus Limnocylindrales bacterium]